MASEMSPALAKAKEIFDALDTDGDGSLNKADLKQGLSSDPEAAALLGDDVEGRSTTSISTATPGHVDGVRAGVRRAAASRSVEFIRVDGIAPRYAHHQGLSLNKRGRSRSAMGSLHMRSEKKRRSS